MIKKSKAKKAPELSPQEVYNAQIKETLAQLQEFVKERRISVLVPCLLEMTYRILKEAKELVNEEEYRGIKASTGGFFAEVVKL